MSPETFRWVMTGFLSLFGLLWGAIGTFLIVERQHVRDALKEVKDQVSVNLSAISTLRVGMARDFVLRHEYLGNVGRIEARLDTVKERLDRHLGMEGGP